MRELQENDLAGIAKAVKNFKVVLEPSDKNLTAFMLHVRARGKGGGTLFTARDKPRLFKNIRTALRLAQRNFGNVEILVLLEPRQRNGNGNKGTGGKNPP